MSRQTVVLSWHRRWLATIGGVLLSLAGQADAAEQAVPAAPTVVPGALTWLVVGDWGHYGSSSQRSVATQMAHTAETLNAKFFISTGDNFYPNGVASVDDPQWQQSFEQVYTDFELHNDWYVVLGNHDYRGNPQAEIDYTQHSRRWHMPARYYRVIKHVDKQTDAEFFFIDTSPFIKDYQKASDEYALAGQDTTAQLAWLKHGLAASTARWKFVVGHHHIYSGGKRATQTELEAALVPLFKEYGVQAYVNGHEHDLQVIRRPGGKTMYLVSGTGSEHRPTGRTEGTLFSASELGFMAMSLTAKECVVQMIREDGALLYKTTID